MSSPDTMKRPEVPTHGLPSPNMTPQPRNQYAAALAAKTMKFFDRMLTAFFTRHMPDSTVANPRFMKKTSMPVTSTQTVSAITLSSAFVGAAGAAGAGSAGLVSPEDGSADFAPSGGWP